MLKSILFLFIFCSSLVLSQPVYDTKYSSEYVLKDARGTELNRFRHYRNGNKLKFTKVSDRGTDKETTTDIYVMKDEAKVYTVISGRGYKSGTRQTMDLSLVGMLTGVYILDLGNDGTIFNSRARNGTAAVLGRDCVVYTITAFGDAKSEYYMYQDNLMLKGWVGSVAEGI